MSSPAPGVTIGVFGTDSASKGAFEAAVAKKSEAEGIIVFHRTDAGRRASLLDTSDYPDRIQGYARIASISDYALYLFPKSGRLSPLDGELAVLLDSFGLPGTIQLLDGSSSPDAAVAFFKGSAVGGYNVEERSSVSSVIDLARAVPRSDMPSNGTLIYIDRAFSVKGVGTVALGFVLSGEVSVHDQLRPIPGESDVRAEVKGIQINDQDFETSSRGIRIGLSLRGVEPKDLERSHWLDDGSFRLTNVLDLGFRKSGFYRQEVAGRDLHVQLLGETLPARLEQGDGGRLKVVLPAEVPAWNGMRVAVLDLNGKPLRVAGGGACNL